MRDIAWQMASWKA